jgi:DNA-binding transcriptional MerR regulator
MAEPKLRAVNGGKKADKGGELTVEQLAFETGMSVRNIRNHQSRALLQPPEVRARTGYYGPQHVARLRLIQEMQAEGYNLKAIKRLIGEQGGSADQFVEMRRALSAPVDSEAPEVLTGEELAERFETGSPKVLEKAVKLGILIPLGDGRFEVPTPGLLRAAEEVVSRGVTLDAALAAMERINRNAQSVSKTFVKLFLDEVWEPFDEAGRPDDRWPEVTESIERLRPLASETLLALFRQTMTAEVEEAFGKVLEQQGKSKD